jgi:hypothetical protein
MNSGVVLHQDKSQEDDRKCITRLIDNDNVDQVYELHVILCCFWQPQARHHRSFSLYRAGRWSNQATVHYSRQLRLAMFHKYIQCHTLHCTLDVEERLILHCFDVQSVFDGTNAFKLLALKYNASNASVWRRKECPRAGLISVVFVKGPGFIATSPARRIKKTRWGVLRAICRLIP